MKIEVKIYISSRKSATDKISEQIYDRLAEHFGSTNIVWNTYFSNTNKDIKTIKSEVRHSNLVLALVGENWLDIDENTGKPYIFNEDDIVRAELDSAMNDILEPTPVFTILLGDTEFPEVEKRFPKPIRSLLFDVSFRKKIRVRAGIKFNDDVVELIREIERWAKNVASSPVNILRPFTFVSELDRKHYPLKVFLCYSSNDETKVTELYYQLSNENNISPWMDKKKLLPGQDWDFQIQNEIRESDVVIVCLSPSSVNKEGYVQKEIMKALNVAEEKPEDTIFLIPVMIKKCEIPRRLSHLQCVNLFEDGGYDRLMRSLRHRSDLLEKTRSIS